MLGNVKRAGGTPAAPYFERTDSVAGVQDARSSGSDAQDIFHWLGLKRIDRFASMR